MKRKKVLKVLMIKFRVGDSQAFDQGAKLDRTAALRGITFNLFNGVLQGR